MSHFSDLSQQGKIGNYGSCRVSLVTLHHRATRSNTLVFAKCCMQLGPVQIPEPEIKQYHLNDAYGYGVITFDLSLEQAEIVYEGLRIQDTWVDPFGHLLITDAGIKELPPRYTAPVKSYRENAFLTGSANGSYWIEFTNEPKKTVTLINSPYQEGLLEQLAPVVKEQLGIDLEAGRDKLGNIIFQFPVNILSVGVAAAGDTKLDIEIQWEMAGAPAPPCFLQAITMEENSVKYCNLETFQGAPLHQLEVGEISDGLTVRMIRTNPSMILHEWRCDCSRITGLVGYFTNDPEEKRVVGTGDDKQVLTLHHPNRAFNPLHYLEHAKLAIARFKAKNNTWKFEEGQRQQALDMLQGIVRKSRSDWIGMIDPYLGAIDIQDVLFYSTQFGRPLRAIGNARKQAPEGKDAEGQPAAATDELTGDELSKAEAHIQNQRTRLNDPSIDREGLNLEFRMKRGNFGSSFHDRYLILSGSLANYEPPKVYSIGTSFNQAGDTLHTIIALEDDAQMIIDRFEAEWDSLADPICLVYKYPTR